jgi:hypothetical protein
MHPKLAETRLSAGVGVHLSLAASEGNVDETASVLDALLRTTLGGLLLLLRLNLFGVANQRSVAILTGAFPCPTLGVCDLTFPARAREPCTLPMIATG